MSNNERGRRMPLARHADKLIETVVLKYPDFALWILDKRLEAGYRWLREYIENLIDLFDDKPFSNVKCRGELNGGPCTREVVRLSIYQNSCEPSYWCSECDPYDHLGSPQIIAIAYGYRDALPAIHSWQGKRKLLRSIGRAKGLTGNFTEKAVLDFFYGV